MSRIPFTNSLLTYWFLVAFVLAPYHLSLSAGGPLGFEELKSAMRTRVLSKVTQEVRSRGISFVPTEGVKAQLEELARQYHAHDSEGYGALLRALDENEPSELVVAVAPFLGGEERDKEELQIAIKEKLEELKEPRVLLRLENALIDRTIRREDEAYEIGNRLGVHLVVWGMWRSKGAKEISFHPKIRVIHTHRKIAIRNGETVERHYNIEPIGDSPRLEVIESAAIKTSTLVVVIIALSYYRGNDYANAANLLRTITQPDSEVYFYLGNCSFYVDNYKEATAYFEQAIAADPNSFKSLHNLATIQYLSSHPQEALQNFEKALRVNPASDKTLNNMGITLVEIGFAEENQQKIARGIEYIREATTVNPANENAWLNYGAVLLRIGHEPSAINALTEYLEIKSEDHSIWFLCGEILSRRLKRYEEAQRFLLKAVDLDPTNGKYIEELVGTWEEVERFDEDSLKSYQRVINLLPNSTLPGGSQTTLRKTLSALILFSQIELGQNKEALDTFRHMAITETEFDNCRGKLSLRLVSGMIPASGFSEPSQAKIYSRTIYLHFFSRHYFDTFLPSIGPKQLVEAYNSLLAQHPSHLGSLIGKGILHAQIMRLPSRAWIHYGFVSEEEDSTDWENEFTRDGIRTLRRALPLTQITRVRSLLTQCIEELEERLPE